MLRDPKAPRRKVAPRIIEAKNFVCIVMTIVRLIQVE